MKGKRSEKRHSQGDQLSPELVELMEQDAGRGIPPKVSTANETDDPLEGHAFGMTAIEQLLLAIIRANGPDVPLTERQRLNRAMKALFGKGVSGNPVPDDRVDQALIWMKRLERDLQTESREKSALSIAEKAAAKFWPNHDHSIDRSKVNLLREKFTGAYDRKKHAAQVRKGAPKRDPSNVPKTLAYRAFQHDGITENVEKQVLNRIASELQKLGVKVSLADW